MAEFTYLEWREDITEDIITENGGKILGYDSTPQVTAENFLCQHSDSKRFSYDSKRIFFTV